MLLVANPVCYLYTILVCGSPSTVFIMFPFSSQGGSSVNVLASLLQNHSSCIDLEYFKDCTYLLGHIKNMATYDALAITVNTNKLPINCSIRKTCITKNVDQSSERLWHSCKQYDYNWQYGACSSHGNRRRSTAPGKFYGQASISIPIPDISSSSVRGAWWWLHPMFNLKHYWGCTTCAKINFAPDSHITTLLGHPLDGIPSVCYTRMILQKKRWA